MARNRLGLYVSAFGVLEVDQLANVVDTYSGKELCGLPLVIRIAGGGSLPWFNYLTSRRG
jgi:hypothetical protein